MPIDEVAQPRRTFEEIASGEMHEAGPVHVTRDAIIAFAQVYDPQSFHLDEAAGAASLLGGLAASGWQTAALGMRLLHQALIRDIACMSAPGIDEVRWLRPVRPGDDLRVTAAVVTTRPSASRSDRGFVTIDMSVLNGRGETVMTQRFTAIVRRRGATEAVPAIAEPHPSGTPNPTVFETDPMLTTFYHDVEIGHHSRFGDQLFTPASMIAFASLYDPQPFHTDDDAARRTHFGRLCASGWQTAAFWMKHYISARTRSAELRATAGLPVAVGGPSPGFSNMKFLRPVFAGETVRYGLTITGKRRAGRSGWGMISTMNTGHGADGTLVFSFDGRLLWPTKPG